MISLEPNPRSFGERLRLYRCRKHMSRRELAEYVGVTTSTISNYENDITAPNMTRLMDIAQALDVTMSMLMYGREPEREYAPLVTDENPRH